MNCRFSLVFASLLLASFAPAMAEDSLVVADNNGVILGPVVSMGSTGNEISFMYRQGAEFALFQTVNPSAIRPAVFSNPGWYVYWSGANCVGSPILVQTLDCCLAQISPTRIVVGTEILTVDLTAIVNPTVVSRMQLSTNVLTSCENLTPVAQAGQALVSWGSITFAPPLHVILNPLIFSDGFQTGDPTRWSNY